jgi:membrane-associated HD superfamily phosphohydrolase|tara:strand:- start:21706 stop:22299 length:594 start_codon:yes stop_codon:yes gene_type:complete
MLNWKREHDMKTDTGNQKYWRFGAMIATSMLVMFGLMYLNTYEWSHARWSETRFYMTFIMGAAMAVIMLSFMLGMYKNTKTNIAIFAGSAVVFVLALFLVRSQTTVQDKAWMSAMIPHHSIAILTSERAEIEDVRVRELADEIIKAQRREIKEMNWLIEDIQQNGPATTEAEANARPVPEFEGKLNPKTSVSASPRP